MESVRKLDLRPLLAVVALVAVAVTMWASGAFAARGGSSSRDVDLDSSAYIQTHDDDDGFAPREDCPEERGGAGGESGGSSGDGSDSNASGAGDL